MGLPYQFIIVSNSISHYKVKTIEIIRAGGIHSLKQKLVHISIMYIIFVYFENSFVHFEV